MSLQDHLCPSVPSHRPPGGPVLPSGRCCSVPVRGWRGHRGVQPCPSLPHRLSLGANQPRHPVAPKTAPWALHPRCHRLKKCPLAAHRRPSMRKGWQGKCKPGTRREVKPPRGKGRGLLSSGAHLLGTMQGVNSGSPGVTLHGGCPLPEPTGAPRCGRQPWLAAGWERGRGQRGLRRGCSSPSPYSCRAVFLASRGC